MDLIIVESPTKAKTLTGFLGKEYLVLATMGHIRDLPKSRLSVDVDRNFEPDYQPVEKRTQTVDKIINAAQKSNAILLATDPDREGEAISQHIRIALNEAGIKKLSKRIQRVVFHEITKEAIDEAILNPKDIDTNLVNAQIARRVLDRLTGYMLSPLLWKKVRRGLSAGRVQTVAVRLIVDREREIGAFTAKEYWEIYIKLLTQKAGSSSSEGFLAKLVKINGKKVEVTEGKTAGQICENLKKARYAVSDVIKREVKQYPNPPFTTSTLTQAAARIFGWSAKRTMRIAQSLYEEGYITYHRTDSYNLASSAVDKVRTYIEKQYSKTYLPPKPVYYKTKSKSAQEAHEAIRPTKITAGLKSSNERIAQDQNKLYSIIFKRFVACQMTPAISDETRIDVSGISKEEKYIFTALGSVLRFAGWKVLYAKGRDSSHAGGNDGAIEAQLLPDLKTSDPLILDFVDPQQKFTLPPARYTEASLIKTMEKLGIGRPSTYAPIVSTIQLRQYVEKKDGKFYATNVGMAANDFLIPNFGDLFDFGFTAQMENSLDLIATGKLEWRKEIKKFYQPFAKTLKVVEKKAKRVKIATEGTGEKCPECKNGELVIRIGRFGKFISCSLFPECRYTRKFVEKLNLVCPKCKKGEVIIKYTKTKRKFFGCSLYPECDWASWKKPD